MAPKPKNSALKSTTSATAGAAGAGGATTRSKSRSRSKFQSVDIIRENQPARFRQDNAPPESISGAGDEDDEWEDGSVPSSDNHANRIDQNGANSNYDGNQSDYPFKGVTVEFEVSPENAKKKRARRATAQDKEVAELVHKVHLLCLLGRGRLVDQACDDPLIQAALLSLVPPHLLKISEATKLTASALKPLVSWFHRNFHVRSPNSAEKPFSSALASALETSGGSPEEVTALSVALFRALNLTTRFVSILDVTSLKPDVDGDEPSYMDIRRGRKDIFDSSTPMVSKMNDEAIDSRKISISDGENACETSVRVTSEVELGQSSSRVSEVAESVAADHLKKSDHLPGEKKSASEEGKHPRRKGDLEFELQLEMALNATALTISKRKSATEVSSSMNSPSNFSSPLKKLKRIAEESPSSSHVSTAIGSSKVGAPLYWAEVYCSGENMTGKWVHIDAVNAIVDGELKVEAAAAACKTSLRYVVAFAGNGAKDVTRRYCTKWYTISPKRINSEWWDAVLYPLKELESRATGGMVPLHEGEMSSIHIAEAGEQRHLQSCNSESGLLQSQNVNASKNPEKSSLCNSSLHSRSNLEDMELATRALTEPLPTSQQAYRNHPLYVLEKWLTKYQILHPKGPILGFCSGQSVYPRTCVQTLHTKERWLREGLRVRDNELPAKVVKSSYKNRKGQLVEVEECGEGESPGANVIDLFGKWQTEPFCLPVAVDGIVPKNERGQVDVWSEKCLPPGTVHFRLPRLVPVAKRLGIDFAPAMVGFEFRNGRSVPVYEGIVVCTEFREAILEAYAEEEQRREEEEKKRDERQALSRWYQLLCSMVTRQRLNNSYRHEAGSETIVAEPS